MKDKGKIFLGGRGPLCRDDGPFVARFRVGCGRILLCLFESESIELSRCRIAID